MKENLRTTRFANGDSISMGSTVYSDFYNIDVNNYILYYAPNDDFSNVPTYGLLYNWWAATHGGAPEYSNANPSGVQGVCPAGWHLPSTSEAGQLQQYIMSKPEYVCAFTANSIAKALADSLNWETSTADCAVGNDLSTNNVTGFTAMPAGTVSLCNYNHSICYYFGSSAMFWTTFWVSNASDAEAFGINSSAYAWTESHFDRRNAYSVRCVRD